MADQVDRRLWGDRSGAETAQGSAEVAPDASDEAREGLRRAMRRAPSPVSVVTASDGRGEIRGITIGSFTSASLSPPLLSFNISREAGIYDLLTRADRFVLHVLHEGQAHLSDRFATPDMPGVEQFRGVDYRVDAQGLPLLTDALATFLCARHAAYDAGDHSILLGRVTDIREAAAGKRPLVYFDRSYRRVGKAAQPASFDPARP